MYVVDLYNPESCLMIPITSPVCVFSLFNDAFSTLLVRLCDISSGVLESLDMSSSRDAGPKFELHRKLPIFLKYKNRNISLPSRYKSPRVRIFVHTCLHV